MRARRRGERSRRVNPAPPCLLAALLLALGGCAGLGLPFADEARKSAAGTAAETAQVDESNYERGKRELAAGRLGLAVLHFQAALDRAPASVDALNGLGAAFDRLGRFDLSMRAYGRALAIEPRSVQTLNNVGYSYLLQGRYGLALAYLRDAAARPGADARILENRRLAEMALARAGGPAPRRTGAAQGLIPDAAGAPFKPRLQRAGKAVRNLVTRPPKTARGDRAVAPSVAGDLLPPFIAAPMALGGAGTGAPALGKATPRPASARGGGT